MWDMLSERLTEQVPQQTQAKQLVLFPALSLVLAEARHKLTQTGQKSRHPSNSISMFDLTKSMHFRSEASTQQDLTESRF